MAGHACSQSVSSRECKRQKGTTAAVCVCVYCKWLNGLSSAAAELRSSDEISLSSLYLQPKYSKKLESLGNIFYFCHFALDDQLMDEGQTPVPEFHCIVLWHGCHLKPVFRTAAWRVCLVLEGAGHQQQLFILPECMFCLFASAAVVAVHRSRLPLWFPVLQLIYLFTQVYLQPLSPPSLPPPSGTVASRL